MSGKIKTTQLSRTPKENKIKSTVSRKIFSVINALFLTAVMVIGISPMIHLFAVSLSTNIYVAAGQVSFWPRGLTPAAYEHLLGQATFFRAFWVSVQRVALGTLVNMVLVVLVAYPLSKEQRVFRARTVYAWIFAFTMFFGGGLIPLFFVVARTGILDSIWALILPGALNVWHMVLLLNFFRGVPKELEEAAHIDGAGHIATMIKIYLPLSLPAMATILLFTVVGHWNAWFDGMVFMSSPAGYPLSTYLAMLVMQADPSARAVMTAEDIMRLAAVDDRTLRVAQIFLGALPVMLVYPFLQRYFIKGIVVGSVKG
ncbi:MAG: carbohydrate ABC transporter permease [Oscillospiraceae bacterium]|nr:carbohydrate ABC transporter permease [Oscillospiraceae bacterium]MCL2278540.1 carbohydrate ABC transporter permease [Oscillospiraceae bacterium]